ncbi:MAG: D-tagatose-1,6-bisphosphate aldolase subunit KbaZ [Litorilinea sp.]|nr:MAG: D-tagatose-1,6-bisphosphate aldolase subunit KbaZ [Litorilinea sp.]
MYPVLENILRAQQQGEALGIPSICSAHPFVLEATFRHALTTGRTVLIESTCNQVNQHGGYTGMTPGDFVAYVAALADRLHFPRERILLGGDHLGPNPWRARPADQALDQARILVQEYVRAGYGKIHLDASMACSGDPADAPLDKAVAAERAAALAEAAEAAFQRMGSGTPPCYVIGTEVPPPGGAQGDDMPLAITAPREVAETIELTQAAFRRRGLEAAWERVIAVVVQPGVEFGDEQVHPYDRAAAAGLARAIEPYGRLVYEAHSTDYQTRQALRDLVADHFAILKVGPALTFAFREAVFALAAVEEEWLAGQAGVVLSRLREELEAAMLQDPTHWRGYYRGDERHQRLARRYSYSDRVRYYWPRPSVQAALERLLHNLEAAPPPLTLLSQYLPVQYWRVREGLLEPTPRSLIVDKIIQVLNDYTWACGG